MRKRAVLLVVLGVVVVGIGLWLWKGRRGDGPAPGAATRPAGSGPAAARAAPRGEPAPASLEVTVTDARGPIGGAAVRLAPAGGEVQVVRTGTDGVARADRLAPGQWRISASAAGHEPAAARPQELAAGAAAKVALVLPVGGRPLTGAVTDASGGPIAGARIDAARLTLGRADRAIATTLTGPDGRYELAVAEGQLLVAARSPDYAAQARNVEVGPAGAVADFALVPGGAIEGVVLDAATRQPVPGAAVSARRERAAGLVLGEAGRIAVAAGEGGRFRVAGLRPGVYELDAGAEGRSSRAATVVGLGVAEQVGDVELLIGAGPAIRGTVVDERDAPVAGAKVAALARGARDVEATTDAAGAFVLDGLGAGRFALLARGEAILPAGPTRVEVRDRDVDGVVVRARRGLAIKGHVEPRQVAEVSLEPGDGGPGGGPGAGPFAGPLLGGARSVVTGPDGAFELSPVAPGKAALSARCPSGDQGSAAVDVAGGAADVVLQVGPGGSIAGRVVDGDGKPVGGVTVVASPAGTTERATIVNGVVTSGVQGLTSGAGAYELKGLGAGAYRLAVLERGKPARLRDRPPQVTLAALEKKTGVDLAMERASGVIKGVVLGPDGGPLADAWVSVHQDLDAMLEGMMGDRGPRRGGPRGPGGAGGAGAGGAGPGGPTGRSRMVTVEATDDDEGGGVSSEAPPALTDAQGRFELRGLVRGAYDVVAEAQAGKLRGRAEDVTPDATLTIRTSGLTTLSGTVRGPAGPAALFTVELEGPTRAQRTFTDGKFELGRVDPGAYVVHVRSSDGNADAKVDVVAGAPATVDVTLAPNAIVIGTIVDGAGKPLAGIPVTVVDQQPGSSSISVSLSGPPPTSGPDGRFRLEHRAGPSAVVVLVPPQPISKRGLVLEAGKTLDVGELRVEAPPPGGPAPPGGPTPR